MPSNINANKALAIISPLMTHHKNTKIFQAKGISWYFSSMNIIKKSTGISKPSVKNSPAKAAKEKNKAPRVSKIGYLSFNFFWQQLDLPLWKIYEKIGIKLVAFNCFLQWSHSERNFSKAWFEP